MKEKRKVAFVCTHNSCRSQMAEAICKLFAGDVLEAYSAGTEIKNQINPDAVRILKELYHCDISQTQHPKLLADIPPVDIVITMGCGVKCPYLPCKHREDWGVEDPTGMPDEKFIQTAKTIENNVLKLKAQFSKG